MDEGLETKLHDEALSRQEVSREPEEMDAGTAGLTAASVTADPVIPAWGRLAYATEFLVALVAIFMTWSQVGGQGHLDLLPWWVKLALVLGLAWCIVRYTASLVDEQRIWSARALIWFLGMMALALTMGGITYYYHLHEAQDEGDSEETTASMVSVPLPGCFSHCTSDRTSG